MLHEDAMRSRNHLETSSPRSARSIGSVIDEQQVVDRDARIVVRRDTEGVAARLFNADKSGPYDFSAAVGLRGQPVTRVQKRTCDCGSDPRERCERAGNKQKPALRRL